MRFDGERKPMILLFDIRTAFPAVSMGYLMAVLRLLDFPPMIINLIEGIYSAVQGSIRVRQDVELLMDMNDQILVRIWIFL